MSRGSEPGTNFPNPRSFEKSKEREVKLRRADADV